MLNNNRTPSQPLQQQGSFLTRAVSHGMSGGNSTLLGGHSGTQAEGAAPFGASLVAVTGGKRTW